MGFGIRELLIILVIVLLLFGTKKLASLGSDLGTAIKGFRKSMGDDDSQPDEEEQEDDAEQEEGEVASAEKQQARDSDKA